MVMVTKVDYLTRPNTTQNLNVTNELTTRISAF